MSNVYHATVSEDDFYPGEIVTYTGGFTEGFKGVSFRAMVMDVTDVPKSCIILRRLSSNGEENPAFICLKDRLTHETRRILSEDQKRNIHNKSKG